MFFLSGDVVVDSRAARWTDRYRAITILPGKTGNVSMVFHPKRRGLFQFPHEICEAMGGTERHQQMHMIDYSADTMRLASQPLHGPSKIFMKASAYLCFQPGFTLLCAENQMVVEAQPSGHERGGLRSFQDRIRLWEVPGVSRTQPPAAVAMMASPSSESNYNIFVAQRTHLDGEAIPATAAGGKRGTSATPGYSRQENRS